MSLLALDVYTAFKLIHCLRVCSLTKTNPGNQSVSLLSQCQNRSVERGPKSELEEGSKNGTQKGEEDEIKEIQKWSRKFRDILMLVHNILPHPFSAKDVVVKLTGKVENALRSKGKSAAVHQKETKLNEKGRSASAIMSRRRCIDHPQKWNAKISDKHRS